MLRVSRVEGCEKAASLRPRQPCTLSWDGRIACSESAEEGFSSGFKRALALLLPPPSKLCRHSLSASASPPWPCDVISSKLQCEKATTCGSG